MGTTSRHSPPLRRRLDPPRSSGWRVLAEAGWRWQRHGAAQAGAAVAFHACAALGCALLVFVALLAANATVLDLAGAIGLSAASGLQALVVAATPHALAGILLGSLGLMAASAAACGTLRRTMNTMQSGPSLPTIAAADIAQSIGGFVMVLIAFGLVFMSLCLGLALWLFATVHATGSITLHTMVVLADAGLSAMLLLPAAALLLRWLPDRPPTPMAAWKGAAAAGLPVVIVKLVLTGWVANAGISTAYGAAGAVLLTMAWTYAAAQLLLFGAAVTASEVDGVETRSALHPGARPLRAPPERLAANTPLPAAAPTSLAAVRARVRPHVRAAAVDERRRGPGVLLQFPAARRQPPN
jgi:membrane protein